MPRNKFLITVFLLTLCVGTVFAVRLSKPSPEELMKKRAAERSIGDPKAPLSLVEYMDYQCPPCATVHGMLKEAMQKYPGKIHLEVRYCPWPAHQNGLKAAVYAECVSYQPGKFWKFHDLLFEHQQKWGHDPYAQIRFMEYAQKAGADVKALDVCVKNPEIEKKVLEEKEKGIASGIKSTPSFYANGRLVLGPDGLKKELDDLEKPNTSS